MVKNVTFLNMLSSYWDKGLNELELQFPDVKFIKNSNPAERPTLLKNAEAVITGRLTADELNSAEKLKIIFVPFTGLNNFPLEILKERNISISNTHANANYVAEKAIALILALLGRVVEYHNELKKGNWFRSFDDSDTWTSIQGKSCGILGYGSIGKNIAKILKGFDCKIIGFKKHITNDNDEYADELSSSINDVISKSDVVFVCLPLNNETKGLISEDILSKMKGKYIVNIARGDIVNEDALYTALKDGTLAGAALDVWYNYPGKKQGPVFPSNKPIYELPNVVISPHKASNTQKAIEDMIDDTIENIRTYLKSGVTPNLIDKERYY
ncbi:MAG: hydroxyacid dehydrogenase [Ignavibacteriae bacterium]|nr:MAG: hydroxyacid dehydrogenase [Ignavibacteriota bacterium]